MNRTAIRVLVLVAAAALAVAAAGFAAGPARADYGPGAVYQVELSANAPGPGQLHGVGGQGGGGIWIWIALNRDGTGDYAGSDCGHGTGAASDKGDVTWHYDGTNVVIDGVVLNGLGGFPTTITVPSAYGHYTGTVGSFLTLPGFLPPFIGTSQLQVAP
jgi:hypothetical protein